MTLEQRKKLCKDLNGKVIFWEHGWIDNTIFHTFKCLILADVVKGISIKPFTNLKNLAKKRYLAFNEGNFESHLKQVSSPDYCFVKITWGETANIDEKYLLSIPKLKYVKITKLFTFSGGIGGSPICPFR